MQEEQDRRESLEFLRQEDDSMQGMLKLLLVKLNDQQQDRKKAQEKDDLRYRQLQKKYILWKTCQRMIV